MRWPWGRTITRLQIIETGKFCLNLSQATLVGTLGSVYVYKVNMYVSAILTVSGIIIAILLFIIAIKLFEGVH